MAFGKIKPSTDAITIDSSNLYEINQNLTKLTNPTYWHKFIIDNVHGLSRNTVLKILFESVKPLDFIPLNYSENGRGAFFFARICKEVIEKFCHDKLTISKPSDVNKPFKMKIVLKYSDTSVVKVDLSGNVYSVLQRRFKTNILCLNNFSEDQALTEFFLLSQPKLLAFILNVAKNLKPVAIKICNNEIKTLDAFKILPAQSIVTLDLRHNLINDLEELKHLKHFNITELWLEGNPLCDLYDEYNYVQNVIKFCPKIEKLDGFLLRQNGVPSFRRNYLCNISAYDVVDQFLEDYFPVYDSKNLTTLESFYHKNTLFSVTTEFIKEQMSSSTSQLKLYKLYSRNLKTVPNNTKNLYTGSDEIMKLFDKLPHSEHDPYSFTVDVLYYTAKCIVIVVTGVFRELPHVERVLGFNRYFVLENRDEHYRIANEQMHVFNALTSQQVTAFKKLSILQEVRSPVQESQMVNTFAIITNLTTEWAKMFLDECHYNLRHAILLFVDLYRGDKIPPQGFKTFDQVL